MNQSVRAPLAPIPFIDVAAQRRRLGSAIDASALTVGWRPDYATLVRFAAPLNDASTTRGAEVASTLTLAAYAARARVDWRLPGTSILPPV